MIRLIIRYEKDVIQIVVLPEVAAEIANIFNDIDNWDNGGCDKAKELFSELKDVDGTIHKIDVDSIMGLQMERIK